MNTPEIWFVNLNIEINNLSRVAFSVFGFEIYWYAILIGLGMASGLIYAVRTAGKTGQDPEIYIDFFFYAVIASIIGARLYFVAFSWDMYKDNLLSIFNTRLGGLAIYGGVIAAVITAVVFTRVKKLNLGLLGDTAVPGLALGQAIGRWGNFINREAFGGYTDNLFALRYMKSQAYNALTPDILDNTVFVGDVEYIQVHPTFLYESAGCLLIFITLHLLRKHKKFDGEIMMLYFLFYGVLRFFIEGLRTDQLTIMNTGIAVSQVLSLVFAVMAAGVIVYKRNLKKV